MLEKLTGSTTVLEKSLDASWIRNQVLAQNIANVDTPNYKRKYVMFEEYLNEAVNGSVKGIMTDERHIPVGQKKLEGISARVMEDNKMLSMRLDGNNVDIDSEMASMAKNTIKYNVLVQSINTGFRRLKTVISEGRR